MDVSAVCSIRNIKYLKNTRSVECGVHSVLVL